MDSARRLTDHILSRIEELEPLSSVVTTSRQELHRLFNPATGEEVGSVQLFCGGEVLEEVLVVHIGAKDLQINAWSVMAFAHPDSLYPHLVFDVAVLPERTAFHIDLLHKQEFSTDLAYVETAMMPLSQDYQAACDNPNFSASDATLLMKSLLNPWMASFHCAPDDLEQCYPLVNGYLDHWISLAGAQSHAFRARGNASAADYDARHRRALFHEKVDAMWANIANFVGREDADYILSIVKGDRVRM